MLARKGLALLLAVLLVAGCFATVLAYDGITRDEEGNISYIPMEQGHYSNGGYTVEKISHPTLGPGSVDGILTGDAQDRGNSYSWSMAESGDYVYIGTCYNSTYYILHNLVATAIKNLQAQGVLDSAIDPVKIAADAVKVVFGVDTFDETLMSEWNAVIMAVHKVTGEAKVVFCERDIWSQYPDIFPGYAPTMAVKNYLSGYRMAFEFQGKIYFAGAGNPTATLIEIDPETNEASIAYYNINKTRGVSWGVHGLLVYDNEILMCIATDNYDGNGTPGGQIVASANPSLGLSSWRVIADQDDFDGLPAVMQTDGLNGGGIWDIIEYNGALYVTIVTDKTIDGEINKQGFAMYRGDKAEDGSFTWTQIVGDHGTSGLPFGMGINHSMSCNLWVYNDYLYLGTYNDPMLDMAEVPATGNFELLYNDLTHSIYLYRMDAGENFELVGGNSDNPYFPEGPIGNLGTGLGDHSNQYVWRMGVHNDEFYIGTYDISTLAFKFTQITDGQVATMEYEDIAGRRDALLSALNELLQLDNPYLAWFLDQVAFSDKTLEIFQELAAFATDMSTDVDPVPDYLELLEKYEELKDSIGALFGTALSDPAFFAEYQQVMGISMYDSADAAPAGYWDDLKKGLVGLLEKLFAGLDELMYDGLIHNFVYYFGCNYYAQRCEEGFDLLVSRDGVNFDAITRDGFGDGSNHGLRTICSTEYGVFLGTANPYYGTQLWLMSSDRDEERELPEETDPTEPSEETEPSEPSDETEPTAPKDDDESAQTADAFTPVLWILMLLTGGTGTAVLASRKKKF